MKSFYQMRQEMMTTGDGNSPKDTSTMGKKRQYQVQTRNFVEVLGKRKKKEVKY